MFSKLCKYFIHGATLFISLAVVVALLLFGVTLVSTYPLVLWPVLFVVLSTVVGYLLVEGEA
jgi:hypothetical protein